ncbi:TPA: hypothetical protein DIV55_02360, partial [Patescibacteria group bacterium]|nr:hypothetical protein [Patescibacteria group bacterium]
TSFEMSSYIINLALTLFVSHFHKVLNHWQLETRFLIGYCFIVQNVRWKHGELILGKSNNGL